MALTKVLTGGIADSAITTAKITDANITTAKVADANITTAKVADDAVTSAKIPANAITDSELNLGSNFAFTGTVSGAGKILQVVHNDDNNDRSLSNDNTTYSLGCEASITPSSTSNKVLIIAHGSCDISSGHYRAITWALFRGSTSIFTNDFHMYDANEQNHNIATQPLMFLDSPSTTSATTYKCSAKHTTGSSFSGTYNGVLNRYHETSILLMEISG